MDAAAELGRSSVSKHQIQPGSGDEQADAVRDCRNRLARPDSQARRRTGEYSFSLFSWPRAGLATLPGWSILLLYVWPYNIIRIKMLYIIGFGLYARKYVYIQLSLQFIDQVFFQLQLVNDTKIKCFFYNFQVRNTKHQVRTNLLQTPPPYWPHQYSFGTSHADKQLS